MTFEVRKGDTSVRSVWTNRVHNAFRKQAGWAKLQKVRATGSDALDGRLLRRKKELNRQREGVSTMKGSGARNALRIWIRGEWGDRRRIRGVRTSSSEKDSASGHELARPGRRVLPPPRACRALQAGVAPTGVSAGFDCDVFNQIDGGFEHPFFERASIYPYARWAGSFPSISTSLWSHRFDSSQKAYPALMKSTQSTLLGRTAP
jgi:hypothetical protein